MSDKKGLGRPVKYEKGLPVRHLRYATRRQVFRECTSDIDLTGYIYIYIYIISRRKTGVRRPPERWDAARISQAGGRYVLERLLS